MTNGSKQLVVTIVMVIAVRLMAQEGYVVPSSSVRVSDPASQTVAGVTLGELGLSPVFEYTLLPGNTLLALGRPGPYGLALTMFPGAGKSPTTTGVDTRETGRSNSPYVLLTTSELDPDKSITVVLVQFLVDRAGARFDVSTTFLRAYLFTTGKLLSAGGPIQIGETNVALYPLTDPKFRWRYLGVDKTEEPGRRSAARILLRDTNEDGFKDVVIWKRMYEARRIDQPGPDFRSTGSSVGVLLFQPSTLTFGPYSETSELQPSEGLWRQAPGLWWPPDL